MVIVVREHGFESVFVPAADSSEAALVEGIRVFPVSTFSELINHLGGESLIQSLESNQAFDVYEETIRCRRFSRVWPRRRCWKPLLSTA